MKQRNRSYGGYNTYLWVDFSKIWRDNIHSIVIIICYDNRLNWLSNWISYHRFPNLGERIQVDLVIKLRKVLESKYFFNGDWNCKSATKVNGICSYKGECCKCCSFYKVTCKFCKYLYIINTQNILKIMKQHFQYVPPKVLHD